MKSKILFITLSNIGDVMLTLPVLDRLKTSFPGYSITVLGSKRVEEIFSGDVLANEFISYNKKSSLKEKFRLFYLLFKENFELVVDLRDTFLGFVLKLKNGIFPFIKIPRSVKHMKDRHFYRAGLSSMPDSGERYFYIGPEDQKRISSLLGREGITEKDKIIAISAGARSQAKIWPKEKFARLASELIEEFNARIILVGDKDDINISHYINESLNCACLDLTGKTNLRELACVLKKSSLLISNDSAVMHMASYFDIPVVAIFGITDEQMYGPWSRKSIAVRKEVYCRPCQKAQCSFKTRDCFNLIKVEDALQAARGLLSSEKELNAVNTENPHKRILITRTDRIGDVVLSTPFIKALRKHYPHAFIAMVVSPHSKDIVDGNPWLDEVIVYDKSCRHKGWASSLKFAHSLKKYKFDAAFILHPTNRMHLITWLSGIPKRVGYDRKFGFLLTDRIPHYKQLGEKHELEYTLELLRGLNTGSCDKSLFMPIKAESDKWAESFIYAQGLKDNDRLLLINPAASCPSKIWPPERFAEVADRLSAKYGLKVLIVSGPKDLALAAKVTDNVHIPVISLAGRISLSQLASILKKSALFISNDSGPVHIASAVGTPVIAIFGRKQAGLSPKRWGPVGLKDKLLHKDIGCFECLAHNCKKGFACLKAVTVEDVLSCADSILK